MSVPRLFDKWKPNEFSNNSSSEYPEEASRSKTIDMWYKFSFTWVHIQSSDVYFPTHSISANLHPEEKYTIEHIFHPQFEEMYHDGVAWMEQKMHEAAVVYPQATGINIRDHSSFARKSIIGANVDYNKIQGGLGNIAERDRLAGAVYLGIEGMLIEKFGVTKAEVMSSPVLGPLLPSIGQAKTLTLENGIMVLTEVVPNSDVNSGDLTFYVLANERGTKEDRVAVYDGIAAHINSGIYQFLREWRAGPARHDGHEASWNIDLSHVKRTINLGSEPIFAALTD